MIKGAINGRKNPTKGAINRYKNLSKGAINGHRNLTNGEFICIITGQPYEKSKKQLFYKREAVF